MPEETKKPEWLKRVEMERDELVKKYKKLQVFLSTNPKVSDAAKKLLHLQKDKMNEYIKILEERIALYIKENN